MKAVAPRELVAVALPPFAFPPSLAGPVSLLGTLVCRGATPEEIRSQVEDSLIPSCKEPDPQVQLLCGFVKAWAGSQDGKYNPEHEAVFSETVKRVPSCTDAWLELARCQMRREDAVAASYTLETANALFPGNGDVLRTLSVLLRSPYALSLHSAIHSIRLGPGSDIPISRTSLATGTSAVDVAKKAVQADTGAPESWKALGLAFLQKALAGSAGGMDPEGINKALLALKKAITLRAGGCTDAETLFNLATVEQLMLRLPAAFQHFTQAGQCDPTFAEAMEMAAAVRTTLVRMRDCVRWGERHGELAKAKGATQRRPGILDGELGGTTALEPVIFRVLKVVSCHIPTILIARAQSHCIVPVVLFFPLRDIPVNSVLKLYEARLGMLHVSFDALDNPVAEGGVRDACIPVVLAESFREGDVEVNGIPITKECVRPLAVSYKGS